MLIWLLIFNLIFISNSDPPTGSELENICLYEKHIYAISKGKFQVLKLNFNGEVEAKIGKRGKGPDEFATDKLRLSVFRDSVFIYDSINRRLTITDLSLNTLEVRHFKQSIFDIGHLGSELHALVMKGKVKGVLDPVFLLQKLPQEKDKAIFEFEDDIKNPVYQYKYLISGKNYIVVHYPYQNKIIINGDDGTETIRIEEFEKLAIGEKTNLDNKSKALRKVVKYPYWPISELIQNAKISDGKLILHIHSYERGDQLLIYSLKQNQIKAFYPSPQGELVGSDGERVYFYYEDNVKAYFFSELGACKSSDLTFFISTFKEQCYSCRQSFFKLYDWVRDHNIPYQFVIKDDNWFTAPDKSDYREVVDYMNQWNVWGAVSFDDNCEECFEDGISVRINSSDVLIPLPAPVADIESKVPCVE